MNRIVAKTTPNCGSMKFKDELLLAATKKYGRNKIFKISSLLGESVNWVRNRLKYLEEYCRIDPLSEKEKNKHEKFWTKQRDLQMIRALRIFPSQYNTVGNIIGVSGETVENRLKVLQGEDIEYIEKDFTIPIDLVKARLENQKTRKELRREFLRGTKKKKNKMINVEKFKFKDIFDFFGSMPKPSNKKK